jgi:hypothetical protein
MKKRIILFTQLFLLPLLLSGCGYHLRSSKSPLLEEYGIRTLFIAPFENDTFKAGVDQVVYNRITQELGASLNVQIVSRPELADAALKGTVTRADYGRAGPLQRARDLEPSDNRTIPSNIQIATAYNAYLNCQFSLAMLPTREERSNDLEKMSTRTIWQNNFRRTLQFPGNNQVGTLGTTSALINDSEFDRTLTSLAEGISSDLKDSLFHYF